VYHTNQKTEHDSCNGLYTTEPHPRAPRRTRGTDMLGMKLKSKKRIGDEESYQRRNRTRCCFSFFLCFWQIISVSFSFKPFFFESGAISHSRTVLCRLDTNTQRPCAENFIPTLNLGTEQIDRVRGNRVNTASLLRKVYTV